MASWCRLRQYSGLAFGGWGSEGMRWKAGEERLIFWHAECFAQGIFNEAMMGTGKAVDLRPVADRR